MNVYRAGRVMRITNWLLCSLGKQFPSQNTMMPWQVDTFAAARKQSGAGLPFSTSSPQLTQEKTDCSFPWPAILAAKVAREVLVASATGTLCWCRCQSSLCAPGISLAVCHLQVCWLCQCRRLSVLVLSVHKVKHIGPFIWAASSVSAGS